MKRTFATTSCHRWDVSDQQVCEPNTSTGSTPASYKTAAPTEKEDSVPTACATSTSTSKRAQFRALEFEVFADTDTSVSDEPVGFDSVPALQHLGDRRLEIVVADPARDPTEMFEGPDMAIQEHLLGLIHIRQRIGAARHRQSHDEHRHLGECTIQIDVDRPEIDFGLRPQRVMLGHRYINQRDRLTIPDRLHVAAHRGLAHLGVVLLDQALLDPPGRVLVLAWHLQARMEPPIDDRLVLIDHRRFPLHSPAGRRQQ